VARAAIDSATAFLRIRNFMSSAARRVADPSLGAEWKRRFPSSRIFLQIRENI
jgi:hypothetical protein